MAIARLLGSLVLVLGITNAAAAVTPLPGTTPQTVKAGELFQEFAVRVTNASGAAVPGVDVQFYDDSFGAIGLAPGLPDSCWSNFLMTFECSARTGADGVARFPKMQGRRTATFSPYVIAYGFGETRLDLTVTPAQIPVVVSVASGNRQRAVIGTELQPIVVAVNTPAGAPVPGAEIIYTPTVWNTGHRGGFNEPLSGARSIFTDAQGRAQLPALIAGWGVGWQTVRVYHFDTAARTSIWLPIDYLATNSQGAVDLDLQDLWWSGPAENGWGVSMFKQDDRLFNVFFVYDDAGRPTWFMQSSGSWRQGVGSDFDGFIHAPRGAPWFAYDATALFVGKPLSSVNTLISFSGPEAFKAFINFDTGLQTTHRVDKELRRMSFARPVPSPLQGVGGIWWGGPQQNGWGVAIHEQEGALFLVWYTYDESGTPTWVYMPEGTWTDASTYAGTIYRASSSAWRNVPYDAARFRAATAGTYSLRFSDKTRAELHYTLDGRSGMLPLQRFFF